MGFKRAVSKFIILEGPDRCGKDTQQNLIIQNLKDSVFHKLHYSALPFKEDKELHMSYSNALYKSMFELMLTSKKEGLNLIFNRSHLGESVYSPLYRGYSGDYVFDIELDYVNSLRENLYLITLIDEPHNLIDRDDSKSFYTDESELKSEILLFTRSHKQSKIKNKLLININGLDEIAVSNIILEHISHKNTVTGDGVQSSLFPE